MLTVLLAALAPLLAPPPPVLCRVRAVVVGIPFPPLRVIVVVLRPGCPPFGHAFVRLISTSGATDPINDFAELTPAFPSVNFRGVLPYWTLEWKAASGKTYVVPEEPGRTDGP